MAVDTLYVPDELDYPDAAAYSDLVLTADGHLGVLYERDNYGRITFALVP